MSAEIKPLYLSIPSVGELPAFRLLFIDPLLPAHLETLDVAGSPYWLRLTTPAEYASIAQRLLLDAGLDTHQTPSICARRRDSNDPPHAARLYWVTGDCESRPYLAEVDIAIGPGRTLSQNEAFTLNTLLIDLHTKLPEGTK